jgi:hypothetical protein
MWGLKNYSYTQHSELIDVLNIIFNSIIQLIM